MKFDLKHIIIFLTLLFINIFGEKESYAQKIDAFARVSVAPREGVVRQPYKVNISVYSSTWFASPLQFTNLRIDNAFIIPFTRTVSGINYINNKKYATLTFYYLVFPYNSGELKIPELVINANIPPEGDYKGQPVSIKTSPQILKINPVPSSENGEVWMVAKNVDVKESWSHPLKNLKVGDVVEREIAIAANGTLPSLIQPLSIEKPDFTSIYSKEADLQDKRNNQDVNGIRIEKYSYLFEKEAEVLIPEEIILWWNPETKRVYKRTIPGQKLSIAANPDLALMKSLKDSLMAMSAVPGQESEENKVPWTKLVLIVLLLFVAGFWGTKTIRSMASKIKKRQIAYVNSEAYYFKKVQQAIQNRNTQELIRKLYIWFDRTRNPGQNASISFFLNNVEKKVLEDILANPKSKPSDKQINDLNLLIKKLRKNLLEPEIQNENASQLNPI